MKDKIWLSVIMAMSCATFIGTIGLFKLPTILEICTDILIIIGFAILTQYGSEALDEENHQVNQPK